MLSVNMGVQFAWRLRGEEWADGVMRGLSLV